MKNTTKRKSECTPEEWEAHLAYHRQRRHDNIEAERARRREYAARPEVKARRKLLDAKPEAVARRAANNQSDQAKQRAKERYKARKENPDIWRSKLDAQARVRTGFTPDVFTKLLAAQNNCCAVCSRSFEGRQIRRDHCHDTHAPRGLLCHHCNIIEGMLKGMQLSPEDFARRLSGYLEHPPALSVEG